MAEFIPATRILLICPCGTYEQAIATNHIINFLKTRRTIQMWGGFTHSAEPSFTGFFWHRRKGKTSAHWEPDHNVLIFIDALGREPSDLRKYLTRIQDTMNTFYREATGKEEDSIWITVSQLEILQ